MLPLPKEPNVNIVNKICSLVESQLLLNKEIKTVNLQTKKDQIEQKIQHNEDRINDLIYQLYDLVDDEIQLIDKV